MKDQNIIIDDSLNKADNFYSPLCKSGYLTPLQRKKLREKRKFECVDFPVQHPQCITKKVKKSLGKNNNKNLSKRKVLSLRKAKHIVQATKKENIPQLHCAITHLLEKKADAYRDRKFFKSRSPDHLEKTNVIIPLWQKNLRLDFGAEKKTLTSVLESEHSKILHCEQHICEELNSKKCEENVCIGANPIPDKCQSFLTLVNEKITPKCSDERTKFIAAPLKPLSSIENKQFATIEHSKEVQNEQQNLSADLKENSNEFDFDWPSDEILLERQNREREICRKRLLQHTRNVLANRKEDKNTSENSNASKLYPVFLHSKISGEGAEIKRINVKKASNCSKDVSKGSDQLIIDAGQKEIGPKICSTCDMVFSIGEENDEALHAKYHNMYLINLKFPGWKNEHVIGEYTDGHVVMVTKESKNFMLKKVKEILVIANRDLGFPSANFPTRPNATFLLFISNDKRVAGCVVAESITSACPVVLDTRSSSETSENNEKEPKHIWKMGNWYCSSEVVPAICGINRIWVAKEYRRRKVASRLIDCLRCHFVYGYVIGIRELAFTDPSPDGREFAAAYTGSDNFLVYK